VLSGEANATAKTHDGPVKALRTLKVFQRSVAKARTQVLNQLPALPVTESDDLRARLRDLTQRDAADLRRNRVAADDDALAAINRFPMRELAQRGLYRDDKLNEVKLRLERIPGDGSAR
jgi:hypothetical protein